MGLFEGQLYRGTPVQFGPDEIERVVVTRENGRVLYEDRVGGAVVGGGDVEETSFSESHGDHPGVTRLTHDWSRV